MVGLDRYIVINFIERIIMQAVILVITVLRGACIYCLKSNHKHIFSKSVVVSLVLDYIGWTRLIW